MDNKYKESNVDISEFVATPWVQIWVNGGLWMESSSLAETDAEAARLRKDNLTFTKRRLYKYEETRWVEETGE